MDPEVEKAIIAVQDGTLASSLKKNMKYTATGIAIGGCAGILLAVITGKPRLMFAIGGAAIGGAGGRLMA